MQNNNEIYKHYYDQLSNYLQWTNQQQQIQRENDSRNIQNKLSQLEYSHRQELAYDRQQAYARDQMMQQNMFNAQRQLEDYIQGNKYLLSYVHNSLNDIKRSNKCLSEQQQKFIKNYHHQYNAIATQYYELKNMNQMIYQAAQQPALVYAQMRSILSPQNMEHNTQRALVQEVE